MIRSILILLCALVLPFREVRAQEVRLQVIATAGMQGRILPRDPYTLQPAAIGWATVATLIRSLKAQNPEALLLDCGNTLSGDPVDYVRNRLKPELPEPSVAIMNALGYQAMTVGGREYDFGFKLLRSVEELAQFPFLSANTVFASTGKGVFTPYVKIAIKGLQVAILGLTSAATPRRVDPANRLDIRVLDPVETARTLIPKLRDKEKADLVIVALQGGLGQGDCEPLGPDPARCLAEKVPGIDLIVGGGSQGQASKVAGVPVLQAGSLGRAIGVADLRLKKERFHWKVDEASLRLEQPTPDTPQDPQVLELTAPLRDQTEAYLNTYATSLQMDLDGRWSCMEDTTLVQLLHTAMRRATGAQLSAVPSPGARIFIPKGPTSVRQFYALAPEEDRVASIRITGAQLRKYLEHAARYFNYSFQPALFNPEVPLRDFDLVSGVKYSLDLTRPVGQRVVVLSYGNADVKDDQVFTLAILTSRLAGSGGYMEAIGFHDQPEVVSSMSLRNALLDYVLSKPTLAVSLSSNWRTIPYLDRQRVLSQQQ